MQTLTQLFSTQHFLPTALSRRSPLGSLLSKIAADATYARLSSIFYHNFFLKIIAIKLAHITSVFILHNKSRRQAGRGDRLYDNTGDNDSGTYRTI